MSRQFDEENRPGLRQRIEERNRERREEEELRRKFARQATLEKDIHVDG